MTNRLFLVFEVFLDERKAFEVTFNEGGVTVGVIEGLEVVFCLLKESKDVIKSVVYLAEGDQCILQLSLQ